MATTLLDLRTRARSRADMENSSFVSDPDLNTWLNLGYAELYDMVVNAFEDYFTSTTPTQFTISSGNTSPLPTDFYKLRGLDYNVQGFWSEVYEFDFHDRNRRGGNSWLFTASITNGRRYRIINDSLVITPDDNATGTYRLYYVPACTLLVADADTLPLTLSKFGWDEYVVLYAAERMLSKEESSVTDVQAQRQEIANRIRAMAANRQVSQSEAISDVNSSSCWPGGWWGNGW